MVILASLQSDWLSVVRFIHKSHFLLYFIFFSANENETVEQNNQNGFKMDVIKWQFWSKIILVISNRTILKSQALFQTKLHSTQFNDH